MRHFSAFNRLVLTGLIAQILFSCSDEPVPSPREGVNQPNSNDEDSTRYPEDEVAVPEPMEWEFAAGLVDEASVRVRRGEQTIVDQNLTMTRQIDTSSRTFTQLVRQQVVDSRTQGGAPATASDVFVQNRIGLLDILLVVSNADSMAEEQGKLASVYSSLLSQVGRAEWQIGITSTDPNDNCLRTIIRKSDVTGPTAFDQGVRVGGGGTMVEEGIMAAVKSLRGDCLGNTPWIRANSTLAVILVSDQDNCSSPGSCAGSPGKDPTYLTNYLAGIRSLGSTAKVYGVYLPPGSSACSSSQTRANRYHNAVQTSGGLNGSVCSAVFTDTFSQISSSLSAMLDMSFLLQFQPDPGRLTVTVDGSAWSPDLFSTSGNRLMFSQAPPFNSLVTVSYARQGGVVFDRMTLTQTPALDTLAVTVNKTPLMQSEFGYESVSNTVIFKTMPPYDSLVEVTYRRNIPLTTVFNIGAEVIPSTLVVKVNSQTVSTYTFNSAVGDIIFSAPPADGASIRADFNRKGAPVLSYPITLPSNARIENVTALDVGGNRLNATFTVSSVTFSAVEFGDGKAVTVRYRNDAPSIDFVLLGSKPLPGSVQIVSDQGICARETDYTVENQLVDLSLCSGRTSLQEILVRYRYALESYQEYRLDALPAHDNDLEEIWQVWIDEEPVDGFILEGTTMRLAQKPAANAKVKVRVEYSR